MQTSVSDSDYAAGVLTQATDQRSSRLRGAAGYLTSLVTASLVAFLLTRKNLQAQFGPVDDHEPLRWMGSDGVLPLSEVIPTLIGDTELGTFGEASRFRPSYYLVRVFQTALFGSDVLSWYVSVLLAYVVASSLFGYAISRWASVTAAAITPSPRVRFWVSLASPICGTLLVISLHAWSGIVTRLGPSELLAMLGAGLATLSATVLLEGRNSSWWIPLIVGVITAVLAKEVMLPWGLLPLVIAYQRVSFGDSHRSLQLASLLGLFSIAVVLAAVLPPVLRGDTAGYGSLEEGSRLALTMQGLFSVYPTYWLPALTALLTSFAVFSRLWLRRDPRLIWTLLLLVLLSVMWFVYDAFVYSGTYELVRYNVVWQLVKVLWISAAMCLSAIALAFARTLIVRFVTGTVVLFSSVLLISALADVPHRMGAIMNASIENANYTSRYQHQIQLLSKTVNRNPGAAVIIVQRSEVNIEGVRAVEQEIEHRFEYSREVFILFDPRHPDFDKLSGDAVDRPTSHANEGPALFELSENDPRVCAFILSDPGGVDVCRGWPSLRIDA